MFTKTKYTKEEFVEAVQSSSSIREALTKLHLNATGANYTCFKRRVKSLQLSLDHFSGQAHLKGKSHTWAPKKPLSEVLKEDSYTTTSHLRKRLVRENLLDYKCSECSISSWNNKVISLQLDHVNGINTDNRIENLRLLCPNCHSQTSTFAGRNIKPKLKAQKLSNDKVKIKAPGKICQDCDKCISRKSTRCKACAGKLRPTKVPWPSIEELKNMICLSSYLAVAKKLGVSDVAVKKHIRNHSAKK